MFGGTGTCPFTVYSTQLALFSQVYYLVMAVMHGVVIQAGIGCTLLTKKLAISPPWLVCKALVGAWVEGKEFIDNSSNNIVCLHHY
jgi:hypothetical protein